MGRMIAFCVIKPATKTEIRNRISAYQKDLISCKKDLDDIKSRKYKNGNPQGMHNAVHLLRDECLRRISHYVPALKELYWVIGEEIPEDIKAIIEEAKRG